MTSIRLTHTALAIAVAAALTSGVAAAAEQTMPSVNTDVLTGQSGDTLKTVSHQEYENKVRSRISERSTLRSGRP